MSVSVCASAGEQPFVTASSVHSQPYVPEYVVDGDRGTRWASRYRRNRPEWIQIDLGRSVPIESVIVHWEHAYAVEYQIQISEDAKIWQLLVHKKDGKDESARFDGLNRKGRYVRLTGLKYGPYALHSIWEIEFLNAEAVEALKEARARAAEARRKAEIERKRLLAALMAKHGVGEIVFAVREPSVDGHWYANFGYYAEDVRRKCYRCKGQLCKVDTGTSKVTTFIDDPTGTVRDPVVHYDAKKILFSWRKGGTEQFHLYEINVDGTGLTQLTNGIYDDIEPTYLPDGGTMFVSSRCKRWVNCWLTQVGVLYRCDADGSNIRQISANIEHDNTPWVLPDGRVLYQRWEYVDRSQVHFHHLWTANPDGTGQMVFFGNLHPGRVFIDAKPIPGTDKVLLINSPGHGRREHAGPVAILDPKLGPDERRMLRNITKNDRCRDPYPLSQDAFLVAVEQKIVLMNAKGEAIDLYLLPKGYGKAELHEPRPVIRRERERVIPSRVDLTEATGRLVLADAYLGRNMEGVKRGEIKKLLVLESLPKPINYTGGMEPMSYGGTFTLERIVGTAPVEEDGSAHMELPANRALFFVALDENDSSVKRMQSFLTVMPGEVTGCVGCHERRVEAPGAIGQFGSLRALRRAASKVTPVRDVPDVLDYPRDVQPILDKHCVKCHSPDERKGGVLLTGDRGPMFSHSFYTLSIRRQIADGRNRARSNYAPRALGDSASPLVKKLTGSHHDVSATPHEIKMVRYWINSGAAYLGTYAGLGTGMVGGYARNQIDRRDLKWPSVKAAAAVMKERCSSCHDKTRPVPCSPSDNMGMPPWAVRYGDFRLRTARHIVYNLTRPEKSGLLLAPLARSAGGWGMQRKDKQGKPVGELTEVFKDTTDPGYQAVLASIRDAKKQLDEIKRFDMPGFKPRPEYVREMKRYGVLPASFDLAKDSVDVYGIDRRYWESLWHRPPANGR